MSNINENRTRSIAVSPPKTDPGRIRHRRGPFFPLDREIPPGWLRIVVRDNFAAKLGAMKKIVSTSDAPAAIGPYSQAIRSGSMLYCAGQIPLDPATGQIVPGDIGEQTKRVLENVAAILKAEHLCFDHVIKTTVFLTSMDDFQAMNEIYGTYFRENPPARSTVAVSALPKGAKVEIEVIAAASENPATGGKTVSDTSG